MYFQNHTEVPQNYQWRPDQCPGLGQRKHRLMTIIGALPLVALRLANIRACIYIYGMGTAFFDPKSRSALSQKSREPLFQYPWLAAMSASQTPAFRDSLWQISITLFYLDNTSLSRQLLIFVIEVLYSSPDLASVLLLMERVEHWTNTSIQG